MPLQLLAGSAAAGAPPACGTVWEPFAVEEASVLQSRASLLQRGRARACGLPCARAGCRAVKVAVQAGVPRAVLASRVPAAAGAVCWGRGSAACQGQLSACRGAPVRLQGEFVGGRSEPCQGNVLVQLSACCIGQGCWQLLLMPTSFPRRLLMSTFMAGVFCWSLFLPESLLPLLSCSSW